MKKLLCFFIGTFLLIGSASAQCINLSPSTISAVADGNLHHYYLTFQNAGLSDNGQYALEYQFYYNGEPISEDSLGLFINKDTSHIATKFMSNSFTGAYIATSHGYFPEQPLALFINLSTTEFNYFLGKYLKWQTSNGNNREQIRFSIEWLRPGDYTIEVKLLEMTGGEQNYGINFNGSVPMGGDNATPTGNIIASSAFVTTKVLSDTTVYICQDELPYTLGNCTWTLDGAGWGAADANGVRFWTQAVQFITQNSPCNINRLDSTQTINVGLYPAITASVNAQGNNTTICSQTTAGYAILTVGGGKAPYSIQPVKDGQNYGDPIEVAQAGSNIKVGGLSAGNYTFVVTDANECSVTTSSINIATAQTDNTITVNTNISHVTCYGGNNGRITTTLSITGTEATPYTYQWSNDSTGTSVSQLTAGEYTVTVTDNMGCIGTATVTVSAAPAITNEVAVTCCNYQLPYRFDEQHADTVFTEAGTKQVKYTASNGCDSVVSVTLTVVTPSVTLSDITGDGTICKGGSTTLTVSPIADGTNGEVTYSWNNQATGNQITVSPMEDTTYVVTATATLGNCTATATKSFEVTVNAPAVVLSDITGTTTICKGNETTLTIAYVADGTNGDVTYVWSNQGTDNSITVSPEDTTTYSVIATATVNTNDVTCTATATKSITVNVNAPAVVLNDITGNTTICKGGNGTTLAVEPSSSKGTVTYAWNNQATGNQISVNPMEDTTYVVTATATVGNCTATATESVDVTVNAPAVVLSDITGTTTICKGNETTLSVEPTSHTGDVTYAWSNQETTSSITVSPEDTTTYSVIATATVNTNDVTCTVTATKSITVNVNAPAIALNDITGNTTICKGGNGTTLTVEPSSSKGTVTYAWTAGNTTINNIDNEHPNTIEVNPEANTTYTVVATATVGSCTATATKSVTVTVNAPAVVLSDITGSSTICAGSNTTLSVVATSNNGTVSYAWTAGETTVGGNTNSITVTPAATTEYTVVATATVSTNDVTCTATATKSFEVTVNAPAVALSDIDPVTICKGSSTTLSVSPIADGTNGDVTYAWSNQGTGNSITVSPTQNTTYIVTATATVNTNNVTCTATDSKSVVVTVNAPALTMAAISGDTHFCLGGNTQLTASTQTNNGTVTYAWTPATYLSTTEGATVTSTPTAAGTIEYEVTGTATVSTNNVTCTATATQSVTVTVNDTVKLSTENTSLLTQSVCAGTDITPVVITYANATVTHSTIPAGMTYSDENNTITLGGAPTTAGEYTITLTATSNQQNPTCDGKTLTFNLNVNPTVTLEATNLTQSVCAGSDITDVVITNSNSTVTTSTLPTGLTFSNNTISGAPEVADTYEIIITATSNQSEPQCAAKRDTLKLTVNPTVTLSATNLTQSVCAGSDINDVVITNTNSTVTTSTLPAGLSFDNNTISGAPTAAGTHEIIITATSNQSEPQCAAKRDTLKLTVNPTVTLSATNLTQSVCAGSDITDVVITNTNSTVTTSTLPTGLTFSNNTISGAPTAAGTHEIIITATSNQSNPQCAAKRDTLKLTVNPTVTLSVTNLTQSVCAGSDITDVVITNTNSTVATPTLPDGLNFNADNNHISGAPTTAGNYEIIITATSNQSNPQCAAKRDTLKLTVNPTVTLSATNLTQSVCAGSDITDVVITNTNSSVETPTLPAGLNFNADNNHISGAPTTAGNYEIIITATSNQSNPQCAAKKDTLKLTVKALPTPTLSDATICASASDVHDTLTLTTDANMNNYSWDVDGGTILEGTNTNSIKVQWAATGAHTIAVTYTDPETECSATTQKTVTVYAAPEFTVTGNPANHSICAVEGNDIITVNSNSNTPYSYEWSAADGLDMEDAPTNNAKEFKSNTAGTYAVTIIGSETHENLTCQTTQNVTVTVNAQPVLTVTPQNPTCHGGNNGKITTTVTGGTPAYTFDWSNNTHSNNAQNLTAGTYSVTVTDGNGCHATATDITLTDPSQITATKSNHVDVNCHGASTGAFIVTASNGTAFDGGQYLYKLGDDQEGTLAASKTFNNLPAGNYVVTVSDRNGCEVEIKDTIVEPAALSVTAISGAANYCLNANATELSVTVAGGNLTEEYEYSWKKSDDNGETWTADGTDNVYTPATSVADTFLYKVTVSDACQNEQTTESVTVVVYSLPTIGDIAEQTICVGTTTTLAPTISGGKAELTYAWYLDNSNESIATTATYTTPAADATDGATHTYKLVVTDACQNTAEKTFTVNVYNALTVGDIADTTICAGTTVTLAPAISGGKADLTYAWYLDNSNEFIATTATYTTPAADATDGATHTYKLVVTDACQNTANNTFTVKVYDALTVGNIADTTICAGATVALEPAISGGKPSLTYAWYLDNSETAISGANTATYTTPAADATNGATHTYKLVVTDACQNTANKTFTVNVYNALTVGNIADTTICVGTTVTLAPAISGGKADLTYAWYLDNSETAISGANAATYTTLGTDATSGATHTYKLVVTDACQNTANKTFTVSVYNALTVGDIADQTICVGTTTTLEPAISGGKPTLTYAWYKGTEAIANATNATYTTPAADAVSGQSTTYKLVVTDACQNTAENSFTVSVVNALTVADIADTTVCVGTSATLTAVPSNGTEPYAYQWYKGNEEIDGETSAIYTTPAADAVSGQSVTYKVVVTDACANTVAVEKTVAVSVAPALTVANIADTTVCVGTSATLTAVPSNGTTPYVYQWYKGNNAINGANSATYTTEAADAVSGQSVTYKVVVTDACNNTVAVEKTATVSVAPALTVANIADTTVCVGTSATLTAVPSNGTTPYVYQWYKGNNAINGANSATYTTPTADAVSGQSVTYKVVVTDACNNTVAVEKTATVSVAPALTVANIADTTVCVGTSATLTAVPSNGTTPYVYQWYKGNEAIANATSATYTTPAADAVSGQSVTYKVVVTDACNNTVPVEKTATVSVAPALTVADIADTTVCVGTSATLTVVPSNGTTPYVYQWYKGDEAIANTNSATYTTPAADAVSGQSVTYKVVVTDACNNTVAVEKTVTVSVAPALTVANIADTTVCVGTSATLTAVPSNGTTPYAYQWYKGNEEIDGETSATYTTPAADAVSGESVTYKVVVTDACANTVAVEKTVTVSVRNALDIAETHTNISCFGGDNGSITVTASNGNPGYQFKIDNESYSELSATTTATYDQLTAGTHTVTVKDNCGTEKSIEIELTQPAALAATVTEQVNVNCYRGNDGSITVTATENTGTAPYTYKRKHVGDFSETNTFSGLVAGKDTIVVMDHNGCSVEVPFEITQPDTLELHEITASHIDVTCHGDADGEIAVAATGGFGTYLYNWNNGGYGGNSAKDQLTAGNYTIVVKDGHQCTASVTVVITEPEELTATIESTNISCYDETDGTITVSVSGGTEPYTYKWNDDNQQNRVAERTHLAAGEYTVTVTDAHYCTSVKNITLTQPANFNVTVSGDAEICADETTIFTADTTGSNLTLQWYKDGVAIADSTARTLSNINVAAIYKVVATHSGSNCTKEATITLTVDTLPNVTITGESSICYNTQVTLTANNADSYVWGEDMGTEPSVTHTLIADRTYTVTGTNSYSCTASASHTVTVNALPSATLSFTMNNEPATAPNNSLELCAGGSITIAAPAANGVSYSWTKDNEPIAETGSTLNLSNITADNAGVYQVKVTNNETNCDSTSNAITIIVNALPTVTLSAVNNVTAICENDNTTLQATCTTEVSYEWHIGNATIAEASSNELTVSEAGKYVVIATDAHGCSNVSDTLPITVNALPTVTLSEDNRLTTICADSAFHFTATSTTATSYAWKHNNVAIDGATASTLRATETGKYVVNVTDEHGCSNASDTLTVTVNPLPEFTISTGNNTEAAICSDGTLNMTAEATATYNYTWDGDYVTVNQETTSLAIFSHAADENATYTVSVTATDNNNCTKTLTKEVTVYALPVVTVNDPTLCLNGTMALTAEGATTYTWTPDTYLNASTGAGVTFTGSVAGTFDIVVTGTDDHNCSSTDTANVTVNALPTTGLTALQNKEICQGATTGWKIEGNYSDFAWTSTLDNSLQPIEGDTVTFTGTTAGEYTVTVSVTDANQCVNSASATVKVDTLPVITLSSDNAVCEGNTITFTTAAANADNGIHNYIWTYPETNATVTGETTGNTLTLSWSDNGTKTVTVNYTDGNGCTATTPATRGIMVNELPDVVITNGETAEICLGGTVNLTAAGATSYVWANEAGNTAAITVEPKRDSTFTVTGTDDNNCSNTAAIDITVHDTVTLIATNTQQTKCLGAEIDGIVLDTANCTLDFGQMSQELTYNAETHKITGRLTSAGVHSFTITATSTYGCSGKSVPVFITMNDTVKLAAADTTQSLCLGTPITAIVLDTAHCTLNLTLPAGLSYNEADHQIEGEIATAGIHHFTVIATNGCGTKQVTGTITMNDTLKLAAADTTQSLCLGTPITAIVLDTAHCTLNLTLPAGLSYNEADHQIEGEIATAGIHHFTVIATNGCGTKQVTGTITMNDTVKLAAADTTQTLCLGTPITAIVLDTAHCTLNLTLPAGLSYNEDDHQIEGEIATAGIHHFTVIATNGCGTKQVTGTITMNDTVKLVAADTTQTLCLGAPITAIVLDTAHCTLNFTLPAGLTYNSANHQIEGEIETAGEHHYTITATNGCGTKQVTGTITMNDTVKLALAGNLNQKFCEGVTMTDVTATVENGTLAVTGQPEGVTLTENVLGGTPTETGTFNYTITASSEACPSSNKSLTGRVVVDTIPAVTITSNVENNTLCEGGQVTLTATAGYASYRWSDQDAESTENTNEVIPSIEVYEYTVVVTNGEGCVNEDEIELTVNTLPTVTLTANADAICADSAFHFTATCQSEDPTYAWKFNNTLIEEAEESTLRATEAGKYVVNVTDENGCSNVSDTLTVTVHTLPVVTTDVVNVSCTERGAVTLIITGEGTSFTCAWNGANPVAVEQTADGYIKAFSNLNGGDYIYAITDNNGCTTNDTVTVGDPGTITGTQSIISDIAQAGICKGSDNIVTFSIDGGTADYTIEWVDVNTNEVVADTIVSDASTTFNLDDLAAGEYLLAMYITDRYGCSGIAADTIHFEVWPTYEVEREINIATGITEYTYNGQTYNVGQTPATERLQTIHGCDSIISYTVNQYDLTILIADNCVMTRSSYTAAYANTPDNLLGDTIYVAKNNAALFYAYLQNTSATTWNEKKMDMSYELLYNEQPIADEDLSSMVSRFKISTYYDRAGLYYGKDSLTSATGEIPSNTLAFRQTANSTVLQFDYFYFDAFKNIPNMVSFTALENGTYTLKLKAELRNSTGGTNRAGIYNPFIVNRRYGHLWGGFGDVPGEKEIIAARTFTIIVNEDGAAPQTATPAPNAISEYSNNASVSTYPNPVNDQLNLVIKGMEGNTQITITDAQGKVVRVINAELTGSDEVLTYNVADFAQGVYFLNVRNNEKVISQKFVVTQR